MSLKSPSQSSTRRHPATRMTRGTLALQGDAGRGSRVGPATLLVVAYVGGAIAMWGTYHDTAWHRTMARDSFWSLPHLLLYGGGALVWAAATTALVLASRGHLADLGGPIARLGRLRLPFGFTLAAAGTLMVVAALPVDIWYHATFGKDVLIWSPPHMLALVGGIVAASGLLFAAAAQRDRGALRAHWLWTLAVVLPAVHIIHGAHWGLAHYTMTPWTRTPDFYPLLAAMMFPAILVALARLVGPTAPLLASALFLAASVLVDLALRAMELERYTITPVIAVPALSVTVAQMMAGRHRARLWHAAVTGIAFTIVFVAMEALWMAWIVAKPWPPQAMLRALPVVLVTGALSGTFGWVWGGFLRAPAIAGGAAAVFGSVHRARAAALGAVVLMIVALVSVYRPQTYGPPMAVAELSLEPVSHFPVQEAVFWEAILDDDFGRVPRQEAYSEGIIDGVPLPIGPAWCASDVAALANELPRWRFGLQVNGAEVDLGAYPIVRQRLPDGRVCGWVGIVSRTQRASRNRFVYTLTPLDPVVARQMSGPLQIVTTVVFKDP